MTMKRLYALLHLLRGSPLLNLERRGNPEPAVLRLTTLFGHTIHLKCVEKTYILTYTRCKLIKKRIVFYHVSATYDGDITPEFKAIVDEPAIFSPLLPRFFSARYQQQEALRAYVGQMHSRLVYAS